MIYLDNAATGGFKPRSVYETVDNTLKYLSANPGRSGHKLSLTGAETVYRTREFLAENFGTVTQKIIFTKNCTEALNMAIFGLISGGEHVITTVYEHNSVLRPLKRLEMIGKISLDVVSVKDKDIVSSIEEKISDKTKLIVTTAVSNVTGERLPFEKIGQLAKQHGVTYVLDCAQLGGHQNINLKNDNVNVACFAGHKGLYGIMGSGVLAIDEDTDIAPFLFGGTGTESFNLSQPSSYPEKLESGTLNLPAISALYEGAKYALSNLPAFSKTLQGMTGLIIDELKKIERISIYSNPNPFGIVSFSVKDISSVEVADILSNDYDIAVRGGLHCAPKIHNFLNTEKEGLVRASLSVQNTSREIYAFIFAINKICNTY